MLRCLRRDGGGGSVTHARACVTARCRRHARVAVMLVTALLTIFAFADAAFAEVDWHDKGSTYSATVAGYPYPDGRPYALAEFLGYDWASLSLTVRQSILTSDNGDNPFASALEHTKNVQYETNGTLNWPIISIWSTIFGLDKMWDIEVTDTLYNQAREHMNRYIYPNEGSPGQAGHPQSGWHTLPAKNIKMPERSGNFTFSAKVYDGLLSNSYTNYNYNNWNALRGDSTVYWVQDSLYNQMVNGTSYEYYLVCNSMNYNNNTKVYRAEVGTTNLTLDENGYTVLNSTSSIYVSDASYTGNYFLNGGVFSKWLDSDYTMRFRSSVGTQVTLVGEYVRYSAGEYDTPVGGPPYVPQPDEPSTPPTLVDPTTPDLPITNAPTTPDSTPNNYTTIINNNLTQPTYNQQPTGTSQDYTPWLDEIVILLRQINDYLYMGFDDMNKWLSAIDVDMRTGFDNVLARLSSLKTGVHSDLVWFADNLNDWITDAAFYLAIYLHECEEYLADIVGEYADQISSVVTWLKRIYSRLGGTGATKPDPTLDEPGFFDWLIDLFTRFINDLLSNLPDWLQRLIGGFQDLSEHFPFSIPWDIAAMLQLLYHEPVTPVFDLPMPTVEIDGVRSVDVHIDLTSWDGVAAIVREMVFIIFAVSLALNTKKLLSNLDM